MTIAETDQDLPGDGKTIAAMRVWKLVTANSETTDSPNCARMRQSHMAVFYLLKIL